jgi:hypothetical protein
MTWTGVPLKGEWAFETNQDASLPFLSQICSLENWMEIEWTGIKKKRVV